ncbi:TonB-dependent receptor plug domain-containing protein [Flavicella sp.]|uniref:TonB-dependent receptor plug domain-containing protein n=1 Tax=Flavicella sp. TaxID=2957742 RepID=UPI003015C33C
MKLNVFLTLLLAFVVQITSAQTKTISGTVTDESGPLPGVSVVIKGTATGAETNFNGNYVISASVGDVLMISYVGMTTKEITIGNSSLINVSMAADSNILDEIVVTALGIKREKKTLGYSVQEVSGDDINHAKEQSFINSLAGRVAGLDVKKSNSLGGSTNVILRGSNSFSGNNQALFVVDGIPVDNSNYNSSTQTSGSGGYDYGNAASDINPEDIESISILKGATASALYGSNAANGVILITTKKGKKTRGLGITISNTTVFSTVDKNTFTTYQNEYGAGYGAFYGDDGTSYFHYYDVNGDGIPDLLVPTGEDASFGVPYNPNLSV